MSSKKSRYAEHFDYPSNVDAIKESLSYWVEVADSGNALSTQDEEEIPDWNRIPHIRGVMFREISAVIRCSLNLDDIYLPEVKV